MRNIMALVPALLAACATNPPSARAEVVEGGPPQPTPVHGVTPGHKCEAAGTGQFVGRTVNSETGSEILRVSHAAVLRWAPPNTMLTMDYREDRVTVDLDQQMKVTKVRCG